MERISIFNYEAFYLDFLEGNLSEEDTALLLAFLEAHPELKVEMDSFPLLEETPLALDAKFKTDLKQISFDLDAITAQNVEQFMIAELEGLLSDKKKRELDQFIGQDAGLIKAKKIIGLTTLEANTSLVFADKASLKRSKRIVLWPYISIAAAASVALFFFVWNPSSNGIDQAINPIAKNKDPKTITTNPVKTDPADSTVYAPSHKNKIIEEQAVEAENKLILASLDKPRTVRPSLGNLTVKEAKTLASKRRDLNVIENASSAKTIVPPTPESNNDYALVGFDEMNNPISPITNRLASAVKQEVDFRSAKATEKRSGGFYLKIGKLEISHRKF